MKLLLSAIVLVDRVHSGETLGDKFGRHVVQPDLGNHLFLAAVKPCDRLEHAVRSEVINWGCNHIEGILEPLNCNKQSKSGQPRCDNRREGACRPVSVSVTATFARIMPSRAL